MASNVDKYVTDDEHALINHTGIPGVGGGASVQAQNNGGAIQGPQPTLNFIPSGATSVSVVENIGQNRIDVTISSTDNNNLSTFETGRGQGGTLSSGAGTFSISGSWPGTFTPHGLILATSSPGANDDFVAIGFAQANLSGVNSQGYMVLTGLGGTHTAGGSSGFLVNIAGPNNVSALTPDANNWNVQRTGASTAPWYYGSMVLGRATV